MRRVVAGRLEGASRLSRSNQLDVFPHQGVGRVAKAWKFGGGQLAAAARCGSALPRRMEGADTALQGSSAQRAGASPVVVRGVSGPHAGLGPPRAGLSHVFFLLEWATGPGAACRCRPAPPAGGFWSGICGAEGAGSVGPVAEAFQ